MVSSLGKKRAEYPLGQMGNSRRRKRGLEYMFLLECLVEDWDGLCLGPDLDIDLPFPRGFC